MISSLSQTTIEFSWDINLYGLKVASQLLPDFSNQVKPLNNVFRAKSLKNPESRSAKLNISVHNRGHFLPAS